MAYIVNREATLSDGAVNNVDVSMPAGHQVDDLIVMFVTQDTGGTIAFPVGWTEMTTQATSQGQRTAAYYILALTDADPDINITSSAVEEIIVSAVLVRGVDTTTPINGNNRTNSANSTSNFLDSGTVTTTEVNCLVLQCIGFDGIAKLIPDDPSSCVNLTKEINGGCVQVVTYLNQLTAAATPVVKYLSEVAAEGGTCLTIAINDSAPATAKLSPMTTQAYTVFKRYGGITTAATSVAAFIRHDAVTFEQLSAITATTIDSNLVLNHALTQIAVQSTTSLWGSMTGINTAVSALGGTGRWTGATHAVSSTNMAGKIFSVEVMISAVTTTLVGVKGIIVYFQDSANNWAAFTISRRAGLLANLTYVAQVDLENQTALDSSGVIDWADITRIAFMSHRIGTATTAVALRFQNAILLDKTIIVDGSLEAPATSAFADQVLNGHGPYLLSSVQGSGQALWKSGVQFGNNSRKTVVDASATSHELPLAANASILRRFWGVRPLSAAARYMIDAGADDTINLTACVVATAVRQNFVIAATSSSSATYSFTGASIVGWDVQHLASGVTISGATLKNCAVQLTDGTISGCNISSPSGPITTNNPAKVSTNIFTSAGTGHAVTGTAVGTFNFFGNTFTGYGADASTDAAFYNNSGGLITLTLAAGDSTPTFRNGAAASTVINAAPVTITATVLADSRIQLFNVTTATEINNVFEATTSYSFSVTSQASTNDVIRMRVTKKGFTPISLTGVFTASGIAFLPAQVADEVYDAYGLDGAAITKFEIDLANLDFDLNVGSNFLGAELYAWYSFALTSADGVRSFYGSITAIDVGNLRLNNSVVDVKLDNQTTTNVFQNDNIRIYRADDAYPVVNPTSGGGGMDINWRNVVYTVSVGGSGLTPAESAALTAIETNSVSLPAKMTVINDGVKNASLLIPHTTNLP